MLELSPDHFATSGISPAAISSVFAGIFSTPSIASFTVFKIASALSPFLTANSAATPPTYTVPAPLPEAPSLEAASVTPIAPFAGTPVFTFARGYTVTGNSAPFPFCGKSCNAARCKGLPYPYRSPTALAFPSSSNLSKPYTASSLPCPITAKRCGNINAFPELKFLYSTLTPHTRLTAVAETPIMPPISVLKLHRFFRPLQTVFLPIPHHPLAESPHKTKRKNLSALRLRQQRFPLSC